MEELRPGGIKLTRELIEAGMEHLGQKSTCGLRLLDIGCGRGESMRSLADEYGFSCTGLEPDDEHLAAARELCPDMPIVQGNAEKLDMEAESFDIALAECVFSLFDPAEAALSRINGVLKKNGAFLFTDVYSLGIGCRGGCGLLRNLYTKEQIEELMTKSGFELLYWQDCGHILKGMLGQLILDHGVQEAYRIIGLDRCSLKGAGYCLAVCKKK